MLVQLPAVRPFRYLAPLEGVQQDAHVAEHRHLILQLGRRLIQMAAGTTALAVIS